MTDCCAEVKAELAVLKTQIANLQTADEDSIINKAVSKAQAVLKPEILAVGTVASAAMTQADLAGSLAKTAKSLADDAISLGGQALDKAGNALGKATSALGQITGILGTLAALGAAIATLLVLGSRIDALEGYVDSLSAGLSQAFGLIGGVDLKATDAQSKAQAAYDFANYAIQKSNDAINKADTAINKANYAVDKANAASAKADIAINDANTAIKKADNAVNKANNAVEKANVATAKADYAINESNAAKSQANAAMNEAVNAKQIAIQLQGTVQTLQNEVYYLQGVTNIAINTANQAINESNSAKNQANTAINKANQATAKANTALNQASGATIKNIAQDNLLTQHGIDIENLKNSPALTVTPSTGITANDAALTTYINTVVQQSSGITAQQAANIQAQQQVTGQQLQNLQTQQQSFQSQVTQLQGTITQTQGKTQQIESNLQAEQGMNQQTLTQIAGLGAMITALPVTLANNQSYNVAMSNAAAVGSCKSLKPGGCPGSQLPGMNNKLDDIITGTGLAGQAAQGVMLQAIHNGVNLLNTKVGTLPVGRTLAGWINGIVSSAAVDRILNLVTLAGVIHNCMMLSTSIQETFFSALDNLFAIPALIKDPNADTIDTKEIFTKYLDKYFTDLFGATEWKSIKAQWKAYSTIYNTGAQVFGNIRDIFDETQQIQYTTSNWVAELGNALTDDGAISEDNWDYKDSKQRPKGKYFGRLDRIRQGLENVEEVFEDLEQVTSSARNIVESANEIKENADIISKAVNDANKAAKDDRDAKIEGLELPNFSLDDLF